MSAHGRLALGFLMAMTVLALLGLLLDAAWLCFIAAPLGIIGIVLAEIRSAREIRDAQAREDAS